VEFEQGGLEKAVYGEQLLKRLGTDLSAKFGRGLVPGDSRVYGKKMIRCRGSQTFYATQSQTISCAKNPSYITSIPAIILRQRAAVNECNAIAPPKLPSANTIAAFPTPPEECAWP